MLGRKDVYYTYIAHRKRSWNLQQETRAVCLSLWACRVEPVIVWSIGSRTELLNFIGPCLLGEFGQDP